MAKLIDLTGQKFGRLTVIKRVENYIQPNGQQKTQWLCKCDCGNNHTALGYLLTNGSVKSCGCLNSEMVIMRNKSLKKKNTYNLDGKYGIGYTYKGEEFYFDLEDYDKIKDYCWHITKKGYVVSQKNEEHGTIRQHRFIMNCPDNFEVDHIHKENKNDNRKSNLRICSHMKNSMNKGIRPDNKSGVTGVYFDKEKKKWFAIITANGKRYKKSFMYFSDAVEQRKEWEEQLFNEYSYKNSQSKEII